MEPGERPSTPRLAWLLPPLAAAMALLLALGAGALLHSHATPPPPPVDLAPVATGTQPLAALAAGHEGDWCALVTSHETALQCYVVRRDATHLYVDPVLVDRTGTEWIADAVGGLEIATTGLVGSATEMRTVRGRAFECQRLDADLPAKAPDEPLRRTSVWISRDVKSLGVVAARIELIGVRREVYEWELAGFGGEGGSGPVAEWGLVPMELIKNLPSMRPSKR